MGIFGSKAIIKAASVSLAEDYNTAQAVHGSAVSIFVEVADQLAEAESRFLMVAAMAQEEITLLTHIRDEAIDAASQAKDSARSVLDLSRGNKQ